jgi:hypothetical protein
MVTTLGKSFFLTLCLLCAVMCIVTPTAAANGTITIAYRGAGGNYIGDTIIFDGTNTIGNVTLIKMSGLGLPPEGVPPYDLSGTPGSGNTALVNENGMWTFSWYSYLGDTSKLQTSRYTFIVSDLSRPEQTATTSVMLKKPEFYMTAIPASPGVGDYITIQGMAERGVGYVKIDVLDPSGTVIHTFMSPVSYDGSFAYSFHGDMSPGQYNIIGSNPSMKNNLALGLTIAAPKTTTTTQSTSVLTTPIPMETTFEAATVTTIPQTPSKTGIASTTIILSLCFFGAILVVRSGMKNK